MKNIKDIHENIIAQNLIKFHTIGDLRDISDLRNVIFNCSVTIEFIKILLTQYDSTKEDILEHMKKVLNDLNKFTVE